MIRTRKSPNVAYLGDRLEDHDKVLYQLVSMGTKGVLVYWGTDLFSRLTWPQLVGLRLAPLEVPSAPPG